MCIRDRRSTEYAMEQMFFVIDSRYRSRRPMIITTNLKLVELKTRLIWPTPVSMTVFWNGVRRDVYKRQQMERAIQNVLVNAIRYSPNGEAIYISLSNDKNTVSCKVENTGVHIPKEMIPHLCTPAGRPGQRRPRRGSRRPSPTGNRGAAGSQGHPR